MNEKSVKKERTSSEIVKTSFLSYFLLLIAENAFRQYSRAHLKFFDNLDLYAITSIKLAYGDRLGNLDS